MQTRASHLIVAFLALWFYLPIATTSPNHVAPARLAEVVVSHSSPSQQDSGTNRFETQQGIAVVEDRNAILVRPAIAATQEGLQNVRVTASKKRVPLGEEVTFTFEPASVVLSPLFTITIYFGDGTQQQVRQLKIIHLYRRVGRYDYSISVKSRQAPSVSLSATPTSVATGNQVQFTAHISYQYPNVQYRFVFGDGSQTDWQVSPQTTHGYASAGFYLAFVDIGVMNNGVMQRMGGSARRRIDVTSTTPTVTPITVNLTARPTSVEVGHPVTFVAQVNRAEPGMKYHFVFGDGSSSNGWQSSPQTTHSYSASGNYPAYVQVALPRYGSLEIAATSEPRLITITSPPTPGVTPTPEEKPSPTVSPTVSPTISPIPPTPVSPTPPIPIAPTSPTPSGTVSPSPTATGSPSPAPTIPPFFPPVPRPRWCFPLILALLLLLLGYWAWRWLFLPDRKRDSQTETEIPEVTPKPPLIIRPPLGPSGPFPDSPLRRVLERRWLHYAFLSLDNKLGLVANIALLGPARDQPRLGTFSTSILLLHREGEGWCAHDGEGWCGSQFNADTLKPFWSAFRQPHPFGVPSPFKIEATSEQVSVDLMLQRTSHPCTSQCAPFAVNQYLRWQSETGVKARGDWNYRGHIYRDVEAVGYHERVRGYWGWPELGGWVFGFANDPARDPDWMAPPIAVVFTLIQPLYPSDSSTASVMLWRRGRLLRHFPRRRVSVAVRGELDKDCIQQVPALSNTLGVPPMATIPRRLVISAAMGRDWVVLDFLCQQAARVVIPSETSINPFSVHEVIGPVKVDGQASGLSFTFETKGIVEFAGGAGGD